MPIIPLRHHPLFVAGRRMFMTRSSLVLSGTAIALLAGCEGMAAQAKKPSAESAADDVTIPSQDDGSDVVPTPTGKASESSNP